ncbi:OsmC family protein [Aquisalimonas lutea]|uniref:OsmC family protein n=1 Tax=Aquisalimonas lutea TaxID=1327750 RepID=UPI0025B46762|nr:OsmC family protein [Aquisalimonas lutea]MDN3519772.1 OsmC family protein [Aquisalimonas lutea]
MSSDAVRNGVDVTALNSAREGITESPESGIAEYGVNVEWNGGTSAQARALPITLGGEKVDRDFSWKVDEPTQLLGKNSAPTPQEYLLSGVGACIMVGFAVGASAKGVKLDRLNVEIFGQLDLSGFLALNDTSPVELAEVRYVIHVSGDASEEEFRELEKKAVELSPNAMSIANKVRLSGDLTIS